MGKKIAIIVGSIFFSGQVVFGDAGNESLLFDASGNHVYVTPGNSYQDQMEIQQQIQAAKFTPITSSEPIVTTVPISQDVINGVAPAGTGAMPCVSSKYSNGYGCTGNLNSTSDGNVSADGGPTSNGRSNGAFNINQLSSACLANYQTAMTECSGNGKGSMAAAGVNGAATVINISQSNNGVNGACKAAESSALANGLGTGVIAYACTSAHSACVASCGNTGYPSDQTAASLCESTFKSFEVMAAAQAVTTAAQIALAGKCNNGTTTAAIPSITGGPAFAGPPADQPPNAGPTPYGGPGTVTPLSPDTTASGTGSGAFGGGAYPGGAGSGAQAKAADPSGVNNPALGLSGGGGGGGWSSGGGGSGAGAGNGAAPFDLASLLPGRGGDPARGPASVASEISGANDLTNFQKVTRMMNKKRPVLKSGEGA